MSTMAFIPGMQGGPEILLVLFVILLLFGAKRLPDLSRSLGKSLGEFKKGKDDIEREIRKTQDDVYEKVTTPKSEDKAVADAGTEPAEEVKAPSSEA
jgi:sec-independent protein translocase protein TatA